jgi:hypothetical protein
MVLTVGCIHVIFTKVTHRPQSWATTGCRHMFCSPFQVKLYRVGLQGRSSSDRLRFQLSSTFDSMVTLVMPLSGIPTR